MILRFRPATRGLVGHERRIKFDTDIFIATDNECLDREFRSNNIGENWPMKLGAFIAA
jgi:hypothetical protein